MARRKSQIQKNSYKPRTPRTREKAPVSFSMDPETARGILTIALVVVGIISLLALFNTAGSFGVMWAKAVASLFGWGAYLFPVLLFVSALAIYLNRHGRHKQDDADDDDTLRPVVEARTLVGIAILTLSLTGIFHIFIPVEQSLSTISTGRGGGYIGLVLGYPLLSFLGFWGAIIILIALLLIGILVTFNISLSSIVARVREMQAKKADQQQANREDLKVKVNELAEGAPEASKIKLNNPFKKFAITEVEESGTLDTTPGAKSGGAKEGSTVDDDADETEDGSDVDLENEFEGQVTAPKQWVSKQPWQAPPLDLLSATTPTVDSGNIKQNVQIIKRTLGDFNIDVEMGEVNVGPTVTQYTLRPAVGIKLSQITSLNNDLALALSAPSIRIEAPIPGRALVGVEVPNKATAIVRLKDLIKSDEFQNSKYMLAAALGRDVAGKPIMAEIERMPHMLIAGATGSGKSVAINSLIISLLYRNSPLDLRFIIVDPKRVELAGYNGIPHLLTPVITNYEKAINALKWTVLEMDRRYELLAKAGKRNILEFNARAKNDKLAYLVVVIDELADLMAVAWQDVEASIVRLAQMARAVGIHLVVATQRPSVDIITGLIKANITARIAFAVASQVDSRTILDAAGAEKLLGSGDALFVTADQSKPRRIQGAYVSDAEVKGVVNWIKENTGEPVYHEAVTTQTAKQSAFPGETFSGDDGDELLDEAEKTVRQAGKASASFLQRRMRIGYARAARILDLLEEKGVVGPGDGAKPREVYGATATTPAAAPTQQPGGKDMFSDEPPLSDDESFTEDQDLS